jgi:hypothetical protein
MSAPIADPAITSAEVMYRETAEIGSRVKHYGQRYTGAATATVVGFRIEPGHSYRGKPWIKVLVEHDDPLTFYNFDDGWDWDRTELAPNL